jgi:hypothetical protein
MTYSCSYMQESEGEGGSLCCGQPTRLRPTLSLKITFSHNIMYDFTKKDCHIGLMAWYFACHCTIFNGGTSCLHPMEVSQ